MSATARQGPRLHVEVPEAPSQVVAEAGPPALPAVEGTSVGTPTPQGPRARSPRRPSSEDESIRLEVHEVFAEQQRLASGTPLGEPELGSLPGLPGSYLRRGERDPGNVHVPRDARSRVGRQGRTDGMRNLREAVESGMDTPRTAASRETLTPDTLITLTDPDFRRANPEAAREADQSVHASHVPAVASEPHEAHTGTNVEIIPATTHIEGIHGSDTTRSLETAFPHPEYEGRPGFHTTGSRAEPNIRSDRGALRGAEQDAAHLEQVFPGARREEIEAGHRWLAERRAELHASEAQSFETPSEVPWIISSETPSSIGPSASSPAQAGARTPGPASSYASHTETIRTPNRQAAMAQYHAQISADPGRESGVWRDANGEYYVMQGDQGSVAPPSASGPLDLVYHSHPTQADAGQQGLMSQPSQAGGDIGVLQHQHGQGPAGRRQSSELHFPTYDETGNQSGYGTTRFVYDPTQPLPLQVETTLPRGRPSRQGYRSFADFEQRAGVGPSGLTTADAIAARMSADAQLRQDTAAAQQRIDTIVEGSQTRPIGLPGMREGREFGRQAVHEQQQAEDSNRPEYGPAYTTSVHGLQPGESIEIPINPAYPEPPGTTAELEALQEQIRVAQATQAELTDTEDAMATQANQQRTHDSQLGEAQGVAQELITGRTTHQTTVDSTASTNTEQQTTATDATSSIGQSAEQAASLATLVGSLRMFQGMAHLFSYLPGALGRSAEEAREDTGELITTLNRVNDTRGVQANIEAGLDEMAVNEQRIETVSSEGGRIDAELTSGQGQLTELGQANAEGLAETESVQQQATQEHAKAAGSENEAQTAHDDLLAQLEAWAQEHRQAREDAIQNATSRLNQLGYEVRQE